MIRNKIIVILSLSASYLIGSCSDEKESHALKRLKAFYVPNYYTPTESENDNMINRNSVTVGRERISESDTLPKFEYTPHALFKNHPINKVMILNSDDDSLRSNESMNIYSIIPTSDSYCQTEKQSSHIYMDKGIQTDSIPEKPFIIRTTMHKEKLSFCELISKLFTCDW